VLETEVAFETTSPDEADDPPLATAAGDEVLLCEGTLTKPDEAGGG
jgi:hypothetical protein